MSTALTHSPRISYSACSAHSKETVRLVPGTSEYPKRPHTSLADIEVAVDPKNQTDYRKRRRQAEWPRREPTCRSQDQKTTGPSRPRPPPSLQPLISGDASRDSAGAAGRGIMMAEEIHNSRPRRDDVNAPAVILRSRKRSASTRICRKFYQVQTSHWRHRQGSL